jgi:excisionase family DNA binding protein
MRLLKDAYTEIKALDPNTAISRYFIRQLVLSGKVPCTMAGRKRLVNLDALIAYLASPEEDENEGC